MLKIQTKKQRNKQDFTFSQKTFGGDSLFILQMIKYTQNLG